MDTRKRYCIQSDGDHEYFIPTDRVTEFELWVAAVEADKQYYGFDWTGNRIDGRFTFTNPRCE